MRLSFFQYGFVFMAAIFLMGCGSTGTQSGVGRIAVKPSPELMQVDEQLDALAMETQTLKDEYTEIQRNVVDRVSLSTGDLNNKTQLIISLSANNVLNVNGRAMSRNDFQNYADKHLPALCHPTPQLNLQTSAGYDAAAWILEILYTRGCTDVDIQ
ncbi:MAG: hypothetical protein FWC40_09555 [Proteobacteria bacterium]|nr:hypothetical protein [Pseudomonadota bacterium]